MSEAYIVRRGGLAKAFAVIAATYPVGSTCTCTNGKKTLKAKDTSGSYLFMIPEAGTWTVSATDGTETESKSINITQRYQSEHVELLYRVLFYKDGNEYTDITGGWEVYNAYGANTSLKDTYIEGSYKSSKDIHSIAKTKNKITFPIQGKTTLKILTDVTSLFSSSTLNRFGLYTQSGMSGDPANSFAYIATCGTIATGKEYSLDISAAQGEYYLAWLNCSKAKMYRMWLE